MKVTAGIEFMRTAVAEALEREAARTAELQAEARRREVPFPDAVDPAALVAEGRLVDISPLSRTVIDTTTTLRGFVVPVFASAGAGEAMQLLGVEPVLAAAWWAAKRDGLNEGLQHSKALPVTMAFRPQGPNGAEAWLFYAFAQRSDGSPYGVIYARGEANPVVPDGTSGKKEKAHE